MNGFLNIPYFLIQDLGLSITEAFVLALIYSLQRSFGVSAMSNNKMATRAGITKRTVSNILAKLERMELIERTGELHERKIKVAPSLKSKMDEEMKKASSTKGKPDVSVPWLEDYMK